MTDVLEHPPPATVPAAPAARAMAAIVLTVVFELPFQPRRGWIPLRQAMSARLLDGYTTATQMEARCVRFARPMKAGG